MFSDNGDDSDEVAVVGQVVDGEVGDKVIADTGDNGDVGVRAVGDDVPLFL